MFCYLVSQCNFLRVVSKSRLPSDVIRIIPQLSSRTAQHRLSRTNCGIASSMPISATQPPYPATPPPVPAPGPVDYVVVNPKTNITPFALPERPPSQIWSNPPNANYTHPTRSTMMMTTTPTSFQQINHQSAQKQTLTSHPKHPSPIKQFLGSKSVHALPTTKRDTSCSSIGLGTATCMPQTSQVSLEKHTASSPNISVVSILSRQGLVTYKLFQLSFVLIFAATWQHWSSCMEKRSQQYTLMPIWDRTFSKFLSLSHSSTTTTKSPMIPCPQNMATNVSSSSRQFRLNPNRMQHSTKSSKSSHFPSMNMNSSSLLITSSSTSSSGCLQTRPHFRACSASEVYFRQSLSNCKSLQANSAPSTPFAVITLADLKATIPPNTTSTAAASTNHSSCSPAIRTSTVMSPHHHSTSCLESSIGCTIYSSSAFQNPRYGLPNSTLLRATIMVDNTKEMPAAGFSDLIVYNSLQHSLRSPSSQRNILFAFYPSSAASQQFVKRASSDNYKLITPTIYPISVKRYCYSMYKDSQPR